MERAIQVSDKIFDFVSITGCAFLIQIDEFLIDAYICRWQLQHEGSIDVLCWSPWSNGRSYVCISKLDFSADGPLPQP